MPGKASAKALDTRRHRAATTTRCPFDPRKPFDPTGIRLGTPSVTSRGMKEPEMSKIAGWFNRVADNAANEAELDKIAGEVKEFCHAFACPGIAR